MIHWRISDRRRRNANEWLDGWKSFCEEKREAHLAVIGCAYTDSATAHDNEMFSHYLYCEANRNVFEELYGLSWETTAENI